MHSWWFSRYILSIPYCAFVFCCKMQIFFWYPLLHHSWIFGLYFLSQSFSKLVFMSSLAFFATFFKFKSHFLAHYSWTCYFDVAEGSFVGSFATYVFILSTYSTSIIFLVQLVWSLSFFRVLVDVLFHLQNFFLMLTFASKTHHSCFYHFQVFFFRMDPFIDSFAFMWHFLESNGIVMQWNWLGNAISCLSQAHIFLHAIP